MNEIEQFKEVFDKGGSTNLELSEGEYIYAVGKQPFTILCKIHKGKHYSYQRDKKAWVKL